MTRLPRSKGWWLLGLATFSAVSGCQHMNNTERGALAGGTIGALTGAAVAGRGKGAQGALIGGAAGVVAGAVGGKMVDNAERRADARAAARHAASLQDIVSMTQSGVSDDVIVNQIRTSGAVYTLSGQDVVYLNNSGVREPVIRELQATAQRPPRHVYTAVPVGQPVYVVQPPPPPPSIGVGVTYTRR